MAFTVPLHFCGITVQGDIGDLTCYTDRFGQKVFYPRVKPHDPPSLKRLNQRALFKWAQACWSALSADDKAILELACSRTSLVMTGQNLFLSCAMKNRSDLYATIAKQSKLDLPPLPERP